MADLRNAILDNDGLDGRSIGVPWRCIAGVIGWRVVVFHLAIGTRFGRNGKRFDTVYAFKLPRGIPV